MLRSEVGKTRKKEQTYDLSHLVPTFPYCSANLGLEADVTKPSPYLFATFCVLRAAADEVPLTFCAVFVC